MPSSCTIFPPFGNFFFSHDPSSLGNVHVIYFSSHSWPKSFLRQKKPLCPMSSSLTLSFHSLDLFSTLFLNYVSNLYMWQTFTQFLLSSLHHIELIHHYPFYLAYKHYNKGRRQQARQTDLSTVTISQTCALELPWSHLPKSCIFKKIDPK